MPRPSATLAQDWVGTRLVLTLRHYGLPSGQHRYSTLTSGVGLTDPPEVTRHATKADALAAHADALAALLTDQEIE
ncbi:MAG: hypothetical protein IT340_19865 [Chloroflexi bacterium]|nr:hypothetical protein [Chloroflexota bacterium]